MTNDRDATNASVDGRTARRDRNRDLVLDAVIDLFTEGTLAPTAADVATRSGVSLRSVYRYFEDQDELVRAAIARHAERVAPLLEVPEPGDGPLEDADRAVRRATHLRLYEAAAPTARGHAAARAEEPLPAASRWRRARATLRDQTEAMFAPELVGDARRRNAGPSSAVADTLLQFESAEHLRVRLGLSPPRPPTSSAAP